MKLFLSFPVFLFLVLSASDNLHAQHRNLTIILLRHAEKDVSATADKTNPDLSAEGKLRAQKLIKKINKYKPDAIYSSNFIRTKLTAMPLAEKREKTVQIYDHKNLGEIKELIMSGKIKRIVIVGHNTTTPALANMLVGVEKYKSLAETEYDKIWLIKIKKKKTKPNKIKEKVIRY